MKNVPNQESLTAKEIFLLMRLIQYLENEQTLPEEEGVDWQTIYSKLNFACLERNKLEKAAKAVRLM